MRLTILIPVLGYMLLLNYEFLKFIQLVSTQTWAPEGVSLAPPIKLIITYLGLCCLGLASAIFVLRCPEAPKNFASEGAFVRSINEVGDPGVDFLQFNYLCHKLGKGRKQKILPQGEMVTLIRCAATLESIAEWLILHSRRAKGFTTTELIAEVVAEKGMPFNFITQIRQALANDRVGLAGAWFAIMDRERPASRRAVWTLYSAGFALLAIPTIWTVFEVIWQIARVTIRT